MGSLKARVAIFGILSVLGSNVFAAEIAFDLHAQHFSKAIAGQYEGARYELPKAFVTTNLKYEDGAYVTKNESGVLNVEVKTPIPDWSVSVDAFYVMGNSQYKTRTIKVTSENGESVLVSFKNLAVTFNGVKVHTPSERQRMTVAITQNSNEIGLVINGVIAGTATRATFGKLKYVDVQAIYEDDNSTGSDYDRVNSLIIGSK
ncbi:hypothetical protein [Leucothrix mucor]|uniref:hypothetical protein n=1 Tax=Leucothrix mucor TaxID=45248 RepID=UPI0003B4CBBB|nr:hypothetical protein [Leucothrix mucor]